MLGEGRASTTCVRAQPTAASCAAKAEHPRLACVRSPHPRASCSAKAEHPRLPCVRGPQPRASCSAKAEHPRLAGRREENRGWSAGACPRAGLRPDPWADHDETSRLTFGASHVLVLFVPCTAPPLTPNALSVRFACILGGLCRAIAARMAKNPATVPLLMLAWSTLRRRVTRFAALAEKAGAGTLRPSRTTTRSSPEPRAPAATGAAPAGRVRLAVPPGSRGSLLRQPASAPARGTRDCGVAAGRAASRASPPPALPDAGGQAHSGGPEAAAPPNRAIPSRPRMAAALPPDLRAPGQHPARPGRAAGG